MMQQERTSWCRDLVKQLLLRLLETCDVQLCRNSLDYEVMVRKSALEVPAIVFQPWTTFTHLSERFEEFPPAFQSSCREKQTSRQVLASHESITCISIQICLSVCTDRNSIHWSVLFETVSQGKGSKVKQNNPIRKKNLFRPKTDFGF